MGQADVANCENIFGNQLRDVDYTGGQMCSFLMIIAISNIHWHRGSCDHNLAWEMIIILPSQKGIETKSAAEYTISAIADYEN